MTRAAQMPEKNTRIDVIACETQPIVIEGLRKSLGDAKDLNFIVGVADPADLVQQVIEYSPKVCILDKALGTSTVFQLISELKIRAPGTEPVLWASEISEVESFRAFQVGVRGILKKTLPVPVILDCIRTVASGNIWD